jgi:hypothetical protein
MGFASMVDRVRADFIEQPRLELSLAQAARLWYLGPDDCRSVLDALADAGFLAWTSGNTIRRAAGDFGFRAADASYVPVRRRPLHHRPTTD